MSVTLELIAAPGQTLTASIFPRGSDTAAQAGIALTERTNCKGVYRGTVTATLTGWHRVEAYDGTDPLVLTDANFNGDAVVFCRDEVQMIASITAAVDLGTLADPINTILSRIAEQVPSGPVVVIPAPDDPTKTRAWGYCYDANGDLAPGVAIQIWMDPARRAAAGHGAYSDEVLTAIADEDGLAQIDIPRGASLRFLMRRRAGVIVAFSGADADTLQLPMVVG